MHANYVNVVLLFKMMKVSRYMLWDHQRPLLLGSEVQGRHLFRPWGTASR